MTDPYRVLGVAPDATEDEIKKAYRALARKYHPDNYADSPLADVAQEKMKEVNEAYEQIQMLRKNGSSSSHGAGRTGATGSTPGYTRIRECINNGRFMEADTLLDSIPQTEIGAEWNYLKGCVLLQKGWYYDAQRYFDIACYMEPNNREYLAARDNIRNNARQFGRGYANSPAGGNDDCCRACQALICADCLCECCGGDLIRCC